MSDPLPPAVPAATVVLLRDTDDGVETLMLRRDSGLAFAGGAWVFPGGRVDPSDYSGGVVVEDDGAVLTAARSAAVREAMEEAGLTVDPASLVWFAHWTPGVAAARRFSTWFFVARAPGGTVVIDDGEIRDHVWIRPAQAIERHRHREIELIPPTWVTLWSLARHTTVDSALAAVSDREPEVFLSRIGDLDGVRVALWRGDAGYEDLDPRRPGARHRLVMADAGWYVERSA